MNAQDILNRLNPVQPEPVWGIWLYIIFFLCLFTLFRQKVPVQSTMLLLVVAMICTIIDKVAVGNFRGAMLPASGCDPKLIFTFFIRVMMFVFPLIAVAQGKTPKTRPFGIITFIIAGVYFLARGIVDWQLLVGGAFMKC